ncbi:calcium-binding protein [Solirubrobacter pauli]|uniref:calcium-binding protein n=1 Tax=Solirubrobacter pauli TaxID=166793 RepID=UPI001476B537|nr:hypothetical protein [Solirubrobacter pauli]
MRLLLAVCAALLCLPASADAARLVNRGGTLTYTGTGAQDRLTVRSTGATVRVSAPTPLHGRGCTTIRTGTAVCRRVRRVVVRTRGGADWVDVRRLRVRAVVFGGDGPDRLEAYTGATELRGGAGDDALYGSDRTVFRGGPGIDAVQTTDASSRIGGVHLARDVEDVVVAFWRLPDQPPGPVTLTGSDRPNHLTTGEDHDTVVGGAGRDVIRTGGGDDTIDARDGEPDRVDCGTGADTVLADAIDQLADSCERGDPVLPPPGQATLVNRDGTLTYTAGPAASTSLSVAPSITPGYDVFVSSPQQPIAVEGCVMTRAYDCAGVRQVVVLGGPGSDAVQATVPVTVHGGAGEDTLVSFRGGLLDGGPGDDSLTAHRAATLQGGSGIDTAYLSPDTRGPRSITLDGVADDGLAGEGNNVLPDVEDVIAALPYDADVPRPTAGPVTIVGSDAANHLWGAQGDDVIVGGKGRDELYGGAGDDRLDARDGEADRVVCDSGDDVALVDPVDLVSASCERISRVPAA